MANLPAQYLWLREVTGPRILLEALKAYGTIETPGPGSNPSILAWAKAVGLRNVYTRDDVPWCGLYCAYAALQAGWTPPTNPLWARNWLTFGNPAGQPALGDILVFSRGSSGHVGFYVGEDDAAFHVLGGNQSDQVMIKRIAKSRLLGARRCPWRINQPEAVKRVVLAANGALSTNEA